MASALHQDGCLSSAVIKQGPVTAKNIFGVWRKHWMVLLSASSVGPTQIVKYEDAKHAHQGTGKQSVYILQNIVNVVRSTGEHGARGITLQLLGNKSKQFTCESEAEASDWLQQIQKTLKTLDRRESLPSGMYFGCLLPNTTTQFQGECVIEVSSTVVTLYSDLRKSKTIITWPITSIRRYEHRPKDKRIRIESGRGAPSGEGIYLLASYSHWEIFKTIDAKTHSIRDTLER